MFKNKKILITGGTGSLGSALTRRLLSTDVNTVRIGRYRSFLLRIHIMKTSRRKKL
jgi:FlaA1/EpsC-like NDP-sugar epimerase